MATLTTTMFDELVGQEIVLVDGNNRHLICKFITEEEGFIIVELRGGGYRMIKLDHVVSIQKSALSRENGQ